MPKRQSVVELRRNLGRLIEEVYYRGEEVIVERHGRPMAVLVPLRAYELWRKREERLKEALQKLQAEAREAAAGKSPEEIEAEVQQVVDEVRRAIANSDETPPQSQE